MASKGHPGFNAVRDQIARRSGIPKANAAAILASSSRKASPAAKKANPNLKKVGGAKKAKGDPAPTPRRRGPTKPTEVHVHVHLPAPGGMPNAAPGGAMESLLSSIGGQNGQGGY